MRGREEKADSVHHRPKKRWMTVLAMLSVVGLLVVCTTGLPDGALLEWGRRAAMLSAGLQQPEGGAQALSERLDRVPAAMGHADGISTTSAGTVSSTNGAAEQEPQGDVQANAPAGSTAGKSQTAIPTRGPNGGLISEQKMNIGSEFVQGVAIKNKTGKSIDIAAQLAIKPKITIQDNSKAPQVLIVHTHTTEAFMPYDAGYYNTGDVTRTRDESKNVCAVGKVVVQQLEEAGIVCIHDTTVHDSPYTGAYTRSLATVEKNLKKYPSIQVVLDLHRDGIMLDSTTKVKPTVTLNGRKAAQIMIIASINSTTANPHPNWPQNLRFALRLQQALNRQYEGLVRPLSVTNSRYNQHVRNGALLIEVGSEGNTLEEAVYSAQLLGKTLAGVLQKL